MYTYPQTHNHIPQILPRTIQALHGGFNRQACLPIIQELLNTTTSLSNDTSFFYQDPSTLHIYSSPLNPIILLPICEQICGGKGMGWYPDTATRLLTWFIPGIFLVSSISLPGIGKRRFGMVCHLFGDPVHSFWSLLEKMEGWNECYRLAWLLHYQQFLPKQSRFKVWEFVRSGKGRRMEKDVRSMAVVIAAIKEVLPRQEKMVVKSINRCSCFHIPSSIENELAGAIVSARVSGNLSTWFAISTYIFGIICAFISKLGGSVGPGGPSGGRIAPAMLLSWLLPNILLSNEVGHLKREDCIRIVRQLEETVRALEGPHEKDCTKSRYPLYRDWTADIQDLDWNIFLDSQPWSGGIYSCQLEKPMFDGTSRSWLLVAVAVTSVLISFSIAFGVLYSFPTFFSCRNVMFVCITFVWLSSPFLTRLIMTNSFFGYDMGSRWRMLVIKDTIIGLFILVVLIASSCGLGNSCRCWAGFNNNIKGVVLAPGRRFTENNDYIYPILIAVCLFAQYMIFKMALYIGKTGLGIMNWSENDRRASLPSRALKREA